MMTLQVGMEIDITEEIEDTTIWMIALVDLVKIATMNDPIDIITTRIEMQRTLVRVGTIAHSRSDLDRGAEIMTVRINPYHTLSAVFVLILVVVMILNDT